MIQIDGSCDIGLFMNTRIGRDVDLTSQGKQRSEVMIINESLYMIFNSWIIADNKIHI